MCFIIFHHEKLLTSQILPTWPAQAERSNMSPWVATGMTSPPTELSGLVIKHGKLGQLGNPVSTWRIVFIAGKVIARQNGWNFQPHSMTPEGIYHISSHEYPMNIPWKVSSTITIDISWYIYHKHPQSIVHHVFSHLTIWSMFQSETHAPLVPPTAVEHLAPYPCDQQRYRISCSAVTIVTGALDEGFHVVMVVPPQLDGWFHGKYHLQPGYSPWKIPTINGGFNGKIIWAVFKTSIKTEWKLFILARNPCAILARPQWELARGQFFKLSLRDLARRWIPEIWCIFACAMQARSWFRTWVSWLLRFSVSQLLDFLACPVASRLLGSNQRRSYFASSVVPECLQWLYGLEPGYNQYSGMAPSPCSGFA